MLKNSKYSWVKLLSWVIGFLLTFNIHVFPWTSRTPRATDLVGLFVLVCIIALLLMGVSLSRRLFYRVLAFSVLLIPMFFNGFMIGGVTPVVDPIRWVLSFGWIFMLSWICRQRALRTVFFKGAIVGTAGALGVVALQVMGFYQLTVNLGLAAQDATVESFFHSVWRAPGMEGHVNGSAAVFSLGVPIALGLIEEGRAGWKWLFIALAVVVTGSALTLNRSSMLVVTGTLTAWVVLANGESITSGWKIAIVALPVVAILMYGPPGGWERWEALENITRSDNFQVRMKTTLAALDIGLENPIGIGKEYQEHIVKRVPGHDATHNALLQLLLMGGVPIFVFVSWRMVKKAFGVFGRGSVEAWVSFHFFQLFMFEEYFAIPTILIFVSWIVIDYKS